MPSSAAMGWSCYVPILFRTHENRMRMSAFTAICLAVSCHLYSFSGIYEATLTLVYLASQDRSN